MKLFWICVEYEAVQIMSSVLLRRILFVSESHFCIVCEVKLSPRVLTVNMIYSILFLSFRRVLNVIYSFLGNSPTSEF